MRPKHEVAADFSVKDGVQQLRVSFSDIFPVRICYMAELINYFYVAGVVLLLFGAAIFVHEFGHFWVALKPFDFQSVNEVYAL